MHTLTSLYTSDPVPGDVLPMLVPRSKLTSLIAHRTFTGQVRRRGLYIQINQSKLLGYNILYNEYYLNSNAQW